MATILLGLGSNLGDRHRNLRVATKGVGTFATVERISSVYLTSPWGVLEQPDYFNICLSADTPLSPNTLLDTIKALEVRIGRKPSMRWGPRHIDIDILFYDDLVLRSERLTIPHPGIPDRAFVLVPLSEIAPDQVHPISGKSVRQMLTDIDTAGILRLSDPLYASEGPGSKEEDQ